MCWEPFSFSSVLLANPQEGPQNLHFFRPCHCENNMHVTTSLEREGNLFYLEINTETENWISCPFRKMFQVSQQRSSIFFMKDCNVKNKTTPPNISTNPSHQELHSVYLTSCCCFHSSIRFCAVDSRSSSLELELSSSSNSRWILCHFFTKDGILVLLFFA